jgi:hypothetical protein
VTGGVVALVAGVATVVQAGRKQGRRRPRPERRTATGQTGGTMGPHDTAAGPQAAADAMDAMHEKGIKAFPAKTSTLGNQLMQPKIDKGVKVFELTAKKIQWETEPGKIRRGLGVQRPGAGAADPRQGRRPRSRHCAQPTAGIDGRALSRSPGAERSGRCAVSSRSRRSNRVSRTRTSSRVPNAGSHMYHSHHNSAKQVGLGLLGAFIVEPKEPTAHDRVDVDEVLVLNDGAHGYTFNGKSFPATQPIVAKLGQKVRIRYMNEGMMIHPMHLHGMHMTVIAKDGWPVPAPWRCDTLNIAPGERWDVIVDCNNPGTWAFHCHILPHAESEHGMFGMVTALVVKK